MTNKSIQRALAALLALVMALSMAACGRKAGGDEAHTGGTDETDGAQDSQFQPLGDKLFVPEEAALPGGLNELASAALAPDGKTLYLADAWQERVTVTYNGFDFEEYRYNYRLLKGELGGGAAAPLPNYQPPEIPEEAGGSVSLSILGVQADGSIWVRERVQWYYYDVPADFDPDKEAAWDYRSETEGGTYYVLLDSEGTELRRVDLSGLCEELGQDPDDPFTNYEISFDGAGNAYLVNHDQVVVVDQNLNVLFSLEGWNMNNGAVALADGTMAVETYVDGGPGGGGGEQLRTIDLENKDWGEGCDVPGNVYRMFGGSGQFLFFYNTGTNLCGWDRGAGEGVELFNWFDTQLNQNGVYFLSMLPDGRMALLTRAESYGSSKPPVLSLLTATDRSLVEVSDKKILTYGTLHLGHEDMQTIQEFNRTNEEYAIQVCDYSELTGGDYQAATTLMRTEIQAGKIPDILNSMNIDVTLLGAKGYLEDLWPWIDSDPDFGREDLMTHVLDVMSQDGKLYQAFSQFQIKTVTGPVSAVGDRFSWTLEDVRELYDSLPEDVSLFGPSMTKSDMFYWAASATLESFVDWETGECGFESEAFKKFLEFCDLFPEEAPEVDDGFSGTYDRIAAGKRLLAIDSLYSFRDLQDSPQMWGEDITWIGYPTADGSCGSALETGDISGTLVMSAACPYKEAAWSFIRERFLPKLGDSYNVDVFSVNKQDFEHSLENAMTPEYKTDRNGEIRMDKWGNPLEEPKSSGSMDGVPYEVYALKQEEADRFMAFYDSVDRADGGSSTIYSIVAEMAGPYFAGDRSLEETCRLIQSRVKLYVNENR